MAGSGTAHLRDGDAVLRVEELEVVFRSRAGDVSAVAGVSFDLFEGESLGVVGESGCGKSSVARAVLQLPPPSAGRVLLRGVDLTDREGADLRRVRSRLQLIFQSPSAALNPRRTAFRIVAEGLGGRGRQRRIDDAGAAAVADALESVGLDPDVARRKRPHEYSGGQCQRIGIARALLRDPEVLICDEPVSALDVSVQAQILNLLRDLRARFGLSLLFISHDLAVVRNLCDRLLVMYLGKVCEVGPTEPVLSAPAHPYTAGLLRSVPGSEVPGSEVEFATMEIPSPVDPPSGCRFRTRCPLATDRCATTEPQVRPIGDGRHVACHHPLVPAGSPGGSTTDSDSNERYCNRRQ